MFNSISDRQMKDSRLYFTKIFKSFCTHTLTHSYTPTVGIQVKELRYALVDFLGKMTTAETCLTVLQYAIGCNEETLMEKAESLFSTEGLVKIVDCNASAWLTTPLQVVLKALEKQPRDTEEATALYTYKVFDHVANWIRFNCKEPSSINKAMKLFIDYIDLEKMDAKDVGYLLDNEPLVSDFLTPAPDVHPRFLLNFIFSHTCSAGATL